MYSYSKEFNPPAPVLSISLSAPLSAETTQVEAIVGSGADITVVPAQIVSRLRLRRVDLVLVSGLERGARESAVYSAMLTLEGVLPPRVYRVLSWDADYAILGRDVLNRLIAVLNGPQERLRIATDAREIRNA